MAAMDFSFPKKEKLCSQKVISELFTSGRSFIRYPFRIVLLTFNEPQEVPAKILISVSKRRFKRANKRNLIKRRIKEAYRLNKHLFIPLLERNNVFTAIAFIYLPTEIKSFGEIEDAMKDTLKDLIKRLSLSEDK